MNPPAANDDGVIVSPPAAPTGPAPERSLPTQAPPSVSAGAAGGYCRIFPPQFGSIDRVPESFKAEFWSVASPWCHIEGQPMHPEFEANLALLEQAVCE